MNHGELRSSQWFARSDEMGLRHRAVLGTIGFDVQAIAGKPIIGICNPASDFNACEVGFQELVPAIKQGVLEAGGIPLEFPVMALGADLLKPADMLYRNLVSMDVEESIRGYPMDGDDTVFKGFTYKGEYFEYFGVLLVGANPALATLSTDYDPYAIPRIQAFDAELERWFSFIEANPGIMYVSDGNPDTVTVPSDLPYELSETLDESKLQGRALVRY